MNASGRGLAGVVTGLLVLLALLVVPPGCASEASQPHGGNTNWLEPCTSSASCAVGQCVCGVCTGACELGGTCEGAARCAEPGSEAIGSSCAEAEGLRAVCLPVCVRETDCAPGATCVEAVCVPGRSVNEEDGGTLGRADGGDGGAADGGALEQEGGVVPARCETGPLVFEDINLDAVVRGELGLTEQEPIRLERARSLTDLPAASEHIESLAGIECLVGLTSLDLKFNELVDLAPLRYLPRLETLGLAGNEALRNITPLAGLSRLKVLELFTTAVDDVGPLSGLTRLTDLRLDNTAALDLRPLSSLTALQSLGLESCGVQDVGALTSLTSLTSLQLSYNDIGDITPLGSLTGLTVLGLASNRLVDVTPLQALTRLQDLRLDDNRLEDVSSLASLTALASLTLNDNTIADVTALASLTELSLLNLSGNQLQTIAPLSTLTKLTTLWIAENQVQDLGPLASLTALDQVYAQTLPLDCAAQVDEIAAIRANGTVLLVPCP